MIEEGQEYTTPEYDDDGNLIETLGEYDVFIEDEIPEEDHDDSYYQAEEGDLAELDYAEDDNVDPIESKILESQERYEMARDAVIERLTAILEKGEISSEDNADLNDVLHDYTDSVNDIKDKITEDTQGNNDTSADSEINTSYVLPEELQHLVDLLNNGGRNDLLFVDEEGRVLVEGEQVPKLKLVELEVEKLVADYAEIKDLVAKKATIEDLNVVKAQIGTLNVGEVIADIIHGNTADIGDLTADIGEIQTLVGENLTMENIASLILTSKKVTVEDAFIKNAMIDSVSAAKINTGILNTNLVNIQSEDGSLILNGTLQQFKDANGKVRIQMGKDAQGNFTFGLFDSTGTGTLIDSNGITEKAIGDGLIVDKMVGDNANISGSKLNINSVITEVNNGTSTIKGSKVKLDEKNQTLEVAFSSMDTAVTEQGKAIGSHTTSIETMQGEISALISDTEILEDGEKVTVKDAYNKLTLKVGEFGVSLKDIQSDFNNMEIGGTNILDNADFRYGKDKWKNSHSCNLYILEPASPTTLAICDKLAKVEIVNGQTYAMITQYHTLIPGQKYTASAYLFLDGEFNNAKPGVRIYYNNSGWNVIRTDCLITAEQIGKWVKITCTFTPNATYPETIIAFGLGGNPGQFCYVALPQLEKGTVSTDFSVKSKDLADDIAGIDTRVKSAETKLTLEGLKTTIGSTYTTPTDVEDKITSKGYATNSDVTQSVNSWSAKFTESGGYNKLYNGDFRNALNNWIDGGNLPAVLCTTLGCPDNMNGIDMGGQIGKTVNYYQEFGYQKIGKMTLSYWTYITSAGVDGTTNPFSNIQVTVWHSDGTVAYLTPPAPSQSQTWEKIKFTINLTKRPTKIRVALYNRDTTKRLYFTNIMLEDGEIANAFTPNPNEVFDGITEISKNGIKVAQSNYNGHTRMRADGFYLNDGKEDVIKCTSTGLVVKGTVNVINGSISESALAGTLIDGQYIKTDTIKARSIQIGDFTNYFTTPTNYTTNAKYPAYAMNSGTGQIFVTNEITHFSGGEKFLVTGFVYAPTTNGGDTNFNLEFCWRDENDSLINTTKIAKAVSPNTQITINDIITIPVRPANAHHGDFKIYCGNSAYSLVYSQPCMRLMYGGDLIVDGAIDGKTITGTDIIGSTFSSKDGLFTVKEDGEVSAWALSAGIISAGELSVDEITNPQYPKSMEGSMQVYIDPKSTTPSETFEDGGTYLSFAHLEEISPRNLNGYWLQIRLMNDITENVVYDTFYNGTLAVELNGKTLKGYIRFIGRTLNARLYGNIVGNTKGIMGSIMPNAGCNRLGYRYCVVAEMCDLVVYDINAYKSVVTDINSGCFLYTDRASGYVSNVVPVNEPYLMLRAHSMSNVYLESSNGMTSDFPIHSVSGAIITVNATKQAGRKGSTNHIWRANNGQVFADGVTWDTTVSSGNNDSTSTDKVTKTVTVKSTSGDTYRSTYTSWKKDGTVRQGNAYGSGNCDGFWFFGSSLSTYLAKNPTAITITVTRQTGGSGSDVNLTMVTHNHTSRPSGAGTVKETLRTFKAGANKSTTITLSSAEIAKLKNYKGVGLKTSYSATNYAVCSGTCTIKVTYEE